MAGKKKRGIKRDKSSKGKFNVYDLIVRYLILVLIALPGMTLFYYVFRPLTVYPVYALLNIFYIVDLVSPTVIILENSLPIEFVKACIAGSAYYLLLILNLSIPDIKWGKRAKMILYSFTAFLAVNVIRILILGIMAYSGSSFFDITHRIFWYSLSTIFVVLIWFSEVKYFKIKQIPFYSDIKNLIQSTDKK
jgi:exosortase/archaeosortase family protein